MSSLFWFGRSGEQAGGAGTIPTGEPRRVVCHIGYIVSLVSLTLLAGWLPLGSVHPQAWAQNPCSATGSITLSISPSGGIQSGNVYFHWDDNVDLPPGTQFGASRKLIIRSTAGVPGRLDNVHNPLNADDDPLEWDSTLRVDGPYEAWIQWDYTINGQPCTFESNKVSFYLGNQPTKEHQPGAKLNMVCGNDNHPPVEGNSETDPQTGNQT